MKAFGRKPLFLFDDSPSEDVTDPIVSNFSKSLQGF